MPKLSIIVPVYNVEKYLGDCLDSIINQEFRDFELILVDDGSADSSGKICDDYSLRDNRIKVFHKPNGGQSSARNVGLDHACGEYITFVDSDDTLSADTFRVNMGILENNHAIDFLQYPIIFGYNSDKENLRTHAPELFTDIRKYLHKLYYERSVTGTVCNKIFKNKLFATLRFREDMIFEDRYILPDLVRQANQIYQSDCGTYYYWSRPGSTLNKKITPYYLKSMIVAISNVLKLLGENRKLDSAYIFQYNDMIHYYDRLCRKSPDSGRELWELISSLRPSLGMIVRSRVSAGIKLRVLKSCVHFRSH